MTNQDKATLRALAGAATPGPWASHAVNGVPSVISLDGFYVAGMVGRPGPNASRESNAAFIVAACSAAVPLLDENERLRDALQSIRKHVKDLPSALAHAIVATCDSAMKGQP